MKTRRRFIRMNGRLQASPEFRTKADADHWFHEMRRKKQFLKDGIIIDDKEGPTFIEYARKWLNRRIENYPMATWRADEQRLRTYVLPILSEVPIGSITTLQVRDLLIKISETGFIKENFKISTSTRTRVKALLSAIFGDALLENPPLVTFNPALGIKFKEKRTGKYKPRVLDDKDQVLYFIFCAKEIGRIEFIVVCIFVMTGLRKQEEIALRWESFKPKKKHLIISEKLEQVSGKILKGTKGGELVTREVPIPNELIALLNEYHNETPFKEQTDFILCKKNGQHYGARDISRMIEKVRSLAGVKISAHGLRHTYGREFAENTGNQKALQAILGHVSSSTTDIYSDLAGGRTKGFGEAVSYPVGVKGSDE